MEARKPRERLLGTTLRTQPDRRLVALAREGSELAQEEIVRRYRVALVRYAGSIVGAAAAEDVVQEALAKGTAALGRAGADVRLRPWLYAIVRNTALNHLRDAGPATVQLDESYDGVEQPPQALERRERVRSLVGGLRRLPRQQREALVKRELEGRSHAEIGAELGVSTGAARQLIFRARESLRIGFGSLLPMPLLRWLAEGGGDGAVGVAAGAGGGAVAAKAAVAIFAAGAAVTAGVAIDHGGGNSPPAREAAVRPAAVAPAGASKADGGRLEAVTEDRSSSGPGPGNDNRSRDGGHGSSDRSGSKASGPGPGDRRGADSGGGPGPSANSGPGSGGSSRDASQLDDRGGSSGGGGNSSSGSSGHGGGDEVVTAPSPSPEPAPTTAPSPVESSSGGPGPSDGGDSSGTLRDLSGGAVSNGSDDPN